MGIPWCYREDSPGMALWGKGFVINLDNRGGRGTHWTAARLTGGVLYYADPFGTILNGYPPKELEKVSREIIWNRISFQHPSTHLCGYYAIYFALAVDQIDRKLSQKEFEQLLYESIV